jgi:hypothetical protein
MPHSVAPAGLRNGHKGALALASDGSSRPRPGFANRSLTPQVAAAQPLTRDAENVLPRPRPPGQRCEVLFCLQGRFLTETRRSRRAAQTLRTSKGRPRSTRCKRHSSTSTSTAALSTSTRRGRPSAIALLSVLLRALGVSVRGFFPYFAAENASQRCLRGLRMLGGPGNDAA